MSVTLFRNPNYAAPSNIDAPVGSPPNWQWYEGTYSALTYNEDIYLPDLNGASITLRFPNGGSAAVQISDAPPITIASVTGTNSNVWQDWPAGVVTETTSRMVYGATAVRVRLVSGVAVLDVRV